MTPNHVDLIRMNEGSAQTKGDKRITRITSAAQESSARRRCAQERALRNAPALKNTYGGAFFSLFLSRQRGFAKNSCAVGHRGAQRARYLWGSALGRCLWLDVRLFGNWVQCAD